MSNILENLSPVLLNNLKNCVEKYCEYTYERSLERTHNEEYAKRSKSIASHNFTQGFVAGMRAVRKYIGYRLKQVIEVEDYTHKQIQRLAWCTNPRDIPMPTEIPCKKVVLTKNQAHDICKRLDYLIKKCEKGSPEYNTLMYIMLNMRSYGAPFFGNNEVEKRIADKLQN